MDDKKVNSVDENNFEEENIGDKLKEADQPSILQDTPEETSTVETASAPKRLNLIENIKKSALNIYKTFLRFPLTLIIFTALASIIIYMTETPYNEPVEKILDRVIGVLILGIPFTLAANLFIEKFWDNVNIFKKILSYSLQIAVLTAYYFFLFPNTDMVPVMRLILITFSLGLTFLFIPYLRGKENFEVFITKIVSKATITAFFTLVIALGLIATLFAVKSLLYNDLSEKHFFYVWVLSWLIFAPVYFLSGFPKTEDIFSIKDYNNIFKILLVFIILPIISIYTVVLYLYFGKILITQVWPKGIVSYLVLSYTSAGIISIFLISSFFKQNKWVDTFTNIYLKLIFPLIGMMFVSIGIRINEFGFTENRYLILATGIWATFAVIFMNFDKGKRNIILPISLAVVAFLAVCGPWDASNISKTSQNNRFSNILNKYGMIANGKVMTGSSKVAYNDQKEISEILRYFDRAHKLSDVKYLPDDFDFSKMKDVFGFEAVDTYRAGGTNYFNYYKPQDAPVIINGYDILFDLEFFNSGSGDNLVYESFSNSQYGNIKISINKKYEMTIFRNGEALYTFNILNNLSELYKKYGYEIKTKEPGKQELVFIDANNKAEIKIIYRLITLTVNNENNNDEIVPNNVKADLLIKFK